MMNRARVYVLLALVFTAMIVMAGCGGDSGSTVFQNVSERASWGIGRIAFASFGGNALLYVYRINDGGGGLVLLTPSDNDEDLSDEGGRHPVFSPDGTQIAISSRRGETPAIYLIGAERGDRDGIQRVTNDAGDGWDSEPNFHPAGDRIVFTSTRRAANGDIRIVNVDGTNDVPLVETDAEEHWGAISPDGTRLAYQSDLNGNTDIYLKDISTLGQAGFDPTAPGTRLTDSPYRDEAPSWSPDGTKIAFHTNRNGDFDIFMMNSDGTGQVAVTADQRSDGYPVFNPAGDRLVITRDRELWTIPAQAWADWQANADDLAEQLTRRF